MSSDVRAWIGTGLRLVLAVILLWSGGAKFLESQPARREAILAYRLPVPASWIDAMALGLPTIEVLLALLLLVGLFTRWAALGTALVMVAFILGIASVWVRGYNINCGCFGGGGDVTGEGRDLRYALEILRDLLFLAMALWLVKWPVTKLSLDRGPRAEDELDQYDDDTDESDEDHTTATLEEPTR